MYSKLMVFVILASLSIASSYAVECGKTEDVTSFTTQDATIVSQIAYIAEFSLKCTGADGVSLFAEIEGRLAPVSRIGENKYQVSWNEEIKKARSGEYVIRLYDDEGFGAARKAQRSGASTSSIKTVGQVTVRHPGAFKGPWIDSELLAAGIATLIAYIAFSTRSKILS